jgi:hypothetical protein
MARRKSGGSRRSKYWIQEAIQKPGALRAYVKRIYGEKGFTSRGTIKREVLLELKKHPNPTIRRRANLALTLRKLGRK